MINKYLLLTKPGRVIGNGITATAGFFLAARGDVDWSLFLAMIAGLSLIVASANVFNNYMDRDIDAKMARTKKRALVAGFVSGKTALLAAAGLGLSGSLILAFLTNALALAAALAGLFIYVVLYGLWKRRSEYGTLVGSLAGATPPVVGYLAVTDNLDAAAVILFLILVLWQMPHFYTIAIYRLKDYKAAGIPVLPATRGIRTTKIHTLVYISAFTIAAQLLTLYQYTGWVYFVVATALGFLWLWLCINGFRAGDDKMWARNMFKLSLLVITTLSAAISVDHWLP